MFACCASNGNAPEVERTVAPANVEPAPVAQPVLQEPEEAKAAPSTPPQVQRAATVFDTKLDFIDSALAINFTATTNSKLFIIKATSSNGGDCALQHGDVITAVDGCVDFRTNSEKLKEKTIVDIKVARPELVEVTLVRQPAVTKVGVSITVLGGQSLVIKAINDGLIREWNRANVGHELAVGDCIVEINGVAKDAPNMMAEIQGAGETIKMTVSRLSKS